MPVAPIENGGRFEAVVVSSRPIILTHLLLPDAQFKKAAGRFAAVVVPILTLLIPVAPIQKGGRFGAVVVLSKRPIVTHLLMPVAQFDTKETHNNNFIDAS